MDQHTVTYPHTQTVVEVSQKLESDRRNGLSSSEAAARLEAYGKNELKAAKKVSPWKILLHNIKNIIVYLLLLAAVAAFVMGDTVEGIAVIIAILIAVVSGFITEYKAQKSVEALQKMIKTTAKVKRDGKVIEIQSSELTVGDLLYLEEGDSVTADARLVETSHAAAMESALTGESEAVDKDHEALCEADAPLGDRTNMVFAGTAVTRGNGYALVTATGMQTEMGKISGMLEGQEQEQTPLEKQLDRLGKSLIYFAAGVAVAITLFGILAGEPIVEMITIGIILAIAAIPEALPAVSTITLAIGMRTMAGKHALVKSLPAVETLGSTTVICTDKTGTLTENQMTVKQVFLPGGTIAAISGSGYDPTGNFSIDGQPVESVTELHALLEAGMLSSNASLTFADGFWQVVGDPTEGGIIAAGRKAGLGRSSLEDSEDSGEGLFGKTEQVRLQEMERIGEIPFNSKDKYMAVACTRKRADSAAASAAASVGVPESAVYIKGAADVLIDMAKLDDEQQKQWQTWSEEMAGEGMRVLAAGRIRNYTGDGSEASIRSALENNIEILGLFGIIDPPREDVKQAIAEARNAGIRVIMITGDHPKTARFIASQIGITDADAADGDKVLTGREMDRLSDEELAEKIRTVSVFARVSPENKLQIVRALNIDEEVTAMTGDGVNDAPALQGADIGIAMGIRGTEVAKEASDMILTNDRFSTIVDAVREGRAIFDNIEKFVFFLFSCNVVEIVLIFLAIAFGLPMPVLALQILWLNLVVDVLPAMSLAWEPGEAGIMQRKPKDPKRGIVNRPFLINILISGALIGLGALAVFWIGLANGYSEELARTASFTTLAVGQLIHIFNVRKKHSFGLDATLFRNPVLLIALGSSLLLQAAVVYIPFMQRVMGTRALNVRQLGLVFLGSAVPTLLIQVIRLLQQKKKKLA
jgi:P-type Ca2+ transporter type 2C